MEQIPNRESEVERMRLKIIAQFKSGRGFLEEGLNIYPELWSDKEVVIVACQNYPGYIESASDELKKDEDFIISLARSINFKNFPNYGVGGKEYLVFIQDAGFDMDDAYRIEKKIKENN